MQRLHIQLVSGDAGVCGSCSCDGEAQPTAAPPCLVYATSCCYRRGTAPSCYDTCEKGETVVATDTYGDGAACSIDGYGHKFLCEVRPAQRA